VATVGFVRMGAIDREADRVPEIGVGMLGYGFMGKAHTTAYRAMPLFMYPPPARPRLVAICGRQLDGVKRAAERYGYERYYTDWRDVIRDPDVELVDIGLPNAVHHGPAIAAADAGKPVLCEKPLATTVQDAVAMTDAVAKAQVKTMVGFNYRFVPALRLAKDLIARGAIGKVLHYHAVYLQEWIMDPAFPRVWRLDRTMAGAGALGDLGSHLIDLARFLVGEIPAMLRAFPLTDATAVVVVTRAHQRDQEVLEAVLGRGAGYVGMIGSRRKIKLVFDTLRAAGCDEALLAEVRAPIGLDIGAETPEEIALAVLAEIVMVRSGGTGASLSQR